MMIKYHFQYRNGNEFSYGREEYENDDSAISNINSKYDGVVIIYKDNHEFGELPYIDIWKGLDIRYGT